MKTSWLATLTLISALATPYALAKTARKPSSEIPARREFPVNSSINPCENFHEYVCSEAEASFKLRDDRSAHTFSFNDSHERILETKKNFMATLTKEKGLDTRAQQFQNYYMSCMNTQGRAQQEKQFVAQTTAEIEKINSPSDFFSYTNKDMGTGKRLGGLFSVFAGNNNENSDINDAFIMTDLMLLPAHDYYENAEIVKAETDLLVEVLKAALPGLSPADAQKRADDIMAMQQDFVKIYPRPAIQRQRWAEKRTMSKKDFVGKFPNIQPETLMAYVPKKALIRVPLPESIEFVNNDFGKYDLQTWKDLMLVDAVLERMDEGYPHIFQKNFDLNKKFFGGPQQRSPLDERCTRLTGRSFSKEIDAVLFARMFPDLKQEKVTEVAEKIRSSILEGIEKNKWLSPSAKKSALEKIKKARLQLVKPNNDREWDFIPQRSYSKTDYIQNLRTLEQASWEKNMKEMREPANKDAWGMGPLTVNAYYSPSDNKFVLPAGILQYPFYDTKGTVIENLGAIGAVIGHELGHGIDDQGSRYDSKGRVNAWMSMKDLAEFSSRGEKMINQFNAAGMDGKLTQGENVADLVGLTFAYHAAFPQNKGSVADKQGFFKSYARSWCEVVRPDFRTKMKKTDPHSDGVSRINEQVKHQAGFAEAFSCKAGDKMTLPESERISIW